jgi:hypothetical protein
MTELRVLLSSAAPVPAVQPDFLSLVRRGRRRNFARRIRLGLAAVALVAGVGSAGANVFAPAAPPQRLTTDRSTGVIDSEVATDAPAAASPAREDAADAARTGAGPKRESTTPLAAAPPPVNEISPATTVVRDESAEGCDLTGRTEGGVTAGPWYADVSGWPSCSYRATEAGGYTAHGTWRIEIRRGNEQLTFTSARDPKCAAVGVVQPGDEVTVMLANDGSDPDERFIRIGPSHHC